MAVVQARWALTWSQLMPRTWAFFSSNRLLNCRNKVAWLVQPEVKSNTWKDRTTFFSPRYWLRDMSPSLTEGRVKSGAMSPISAGMFFPFLIRIRVLGPHPGQTPQRLYPTGAAHTTALSVWSHSWASQGYSQRPPWPHRVENHTWYTGPKSEPGAEQIQRPLA